MAQVKIEVTLDMNVGGNKTYDSDMDAELDHIENQIKRFFNGAMGWGMPDIEITITD